MSTVCGAHVGGWADVGACSAEGGRRPGRIRRRAARGRCVEGLFATPNKTVKRQNGPFYWLTRDVAPVPIPRSPLGRILGTQTFRVAGVFAFYLHTFFGRPGFFILPTHKNIPTPAWPFSVAPGDQIQDF